MRHMRNALVIFFGFLIASTPLHADVGYSAAVPEADRLIEQGNFKQAQSILTWNLNDKSLSAEQRKKVEFQIDWLERTRQDYPMTKDALFQKLLKAVQYLTPSEFDKWVREGRFDSRKIDGVEHYVSTSVANLFFRHQELAYRRTEDRNHVSEQLGRLAAARAIKMTAQAQHTPYVLPYHLKCALDIKLDETAAPAGETIRGWLPLPRANDHQKYIQILSSFPAKMLLASENSPIRSAYMEQKADGVNPTEFIINFTYASYGVHFEMDPAKIVPANLNDPELKKFTSEQPHVIFNERIRKLAEDIAGKETNQMLKAKAFFDWISANIVYSYAREYSTLTNISDYTVCNKDGDCGQEGMLFITLCRSAGIPARWQTGWDLWPEDHDIHDWSEIYLAPYRWIPCDPWAAIFAKQYCHALAPEEQIELRDFYFGGLDQWRMIVNSDHSQPLNPPKNSFRSDDIDFQRGEFEWGNHNIYFNKYDSYKINVERMDAK